MGKATTPKTELGMLFKESNGYVSMEAEHYQKAVDEGDIQWQVIPNLGRTSSAVNAVPVIASVQELKADSPHLEYNVDLTKAGKVAVTVYLSPTVNFLDDKSSGNTKRFGLRYAISFNDEKPQVVDIHEKDTIADWRNGPVWMQAVADNIRKLTTTHNIKTPGKNVLKFWLVDPGVILQKIVIDAGGVKPSYLGPPESNRVVIIQKGNVKNSYKDCQN
jgi:hypothetical protein